MNKALVVLIGDYGDGNNFDEDTYVDVLGYAYQWPKSVIDYDGEEVEKRTFHTEDDIAEWADARFDTWFLAHLPLPKE